MKKLVLASACLTGLTLVAGCGSVSAPGPDQNTAPAAANASSQPANGMAASAKSGQQGSAMSAAAQNTSARPFGMTQEQFKAELATKSVLEIAKEHQSSAKSRS